MNVCCLFQFGPLPWFAEANARFGDLRVGTATQDPHFYLKVSWPGHKSLLDQSALTLRWDKTSEVSC